VGKFRRKKKGRKKGDGKEIWGGKLEFQVVFLLINIEGFLMQWGGVTKKIRRLEDDALFLEKEKLST